MEHLLTAVCLLLYKALFVLSGPDVVLVIAPTHIHGTKGQPLLLPVEYNFAIKDVDIQGSWHLKNKSNGLTHLVTFRNKTVIADMHMEYTNKFSFHPPNASLKINRLDDTEEGEYELTINIRFSNDAQPVKKTKSIKVTVDVPVSRPLIRLTPATAAIEDKDNVTLSCWVQNGTRVQYRWLRETNPLQPGARHTLSDGHSVLRISPVRKADMGNYTCEASNYISRQQSQKLPLNVFYGPYNLAVNSDIGLQTGQVFTVDPGELVSFDCWADSNPPNTYVWISKGINFTEVIMTGPRFEVKSLTLAHREDYTCRAYNNVTQKQDEAQFTIVVAGLGIGREKHSQVGSSISPVAAITVTSLIVITCMVFVLFRKACHPQKVIRNMYNRPLTEQKRPHLSGHEDATEDFGIYEFIAIPGKSDPTQASSRSLSRLDSAQDLHTTIYDVIRHIPETPPQGPLK